jgi:hypothetical protein
MFMYICAFMFFHYAYSIGFFYEMIVHIFYITCFKGLDMNVYMHIFV